MSRIHTRDIHSIILSEYSGILMMELRSRYFDYIAESIDSIKAILESLILKRVSPSRIALCQQPIAPSAESTGRPWRIDDMVRHAKDYLSRSLSESEGKQRIG